MSAPAEAPRPRRDIASDRIASDRIAGVSVITGTPHRDRRGSLTEVHRDDWESAPRPVQWDRVESRPGVLRGVHVHRARWDFFVTIDGRATIGLTDVRHHSPTFGLPMLIECPDGVSTSVAVPPGVAHGIYAHQRLLYLYGLSVHYDGSDEDLGCRHDDPDLGLDWPSPAPTLAGRDLELPDFAVLVEQYNAARDAADGEGREADDEGGAGH